MLDIKFVRDNIEEVQKNIEKRSVKADAQLVVDLYKRKNEL
jgi:seryl-tRNA synthetase